MVRPLPLTTYRVYWHAVVDTFEAVKATALLLILCRVYIQNRKEDDRAVRSDHERTFTKAAVVSVLIDTGITLFEL